MPPRRHGASRQHSTSTLATVIIRFLLVLVQQRLLPRPRNQLLRIQGSLEFTSATSEPVPLLPNRKWQLLRTTNRNKALPTAQPDALVVTIISSLAIFPVPVRHLATSGNPTQQLHALL